MSNNEKVNILKYFLLCESLTPKQIERQTPQKANKQSKLVFNTTQSLLSRQISAAYTRLELNKKITTFAILGSLYPTKNIQNKLKKFANTYTPNEEDGLSAGFALVFEEIDFITNTCVLDIHESEHNDDISLAPIIASLIDEDTCFEELCGICDGSPVINFHLKFTEWAKNRFLAKRFDYKTEQSTEEKQKHFYIKISFEELDEIYNHVLFLYAQTLKEKEPFVSDKIQCIFLSYKTSTKYTPMMHSFYIDDLKHAINIYSKEEGSNALLDEFLSTGAVSGRIDLRSDFGNEFFISALQKNEFSAGAFPFGVKLNESQNFAINQAMKRFELASRDDFIQNTGFYAINGAPGTGKTTILKEMCASIYTQRAIELASLDEEEITINGLLNPILYGYDMTIFSSNNLAVENVSAELSNKDDIDELLINELESVDYFSDIAKRYWDEDSWGIFGMKFGNRENIKKFKFDFCYNVNKQEDETKNDKYYELLQKFPNLAMDDRILGFLSYIFYYKGTMSFEKAKDEFKASLKEFDEMLKQNCIDTNALKDEQKKLVNSLDNADNMEQIKQITARLKQISALLNGESLPENSNIYVKDDFNLIRKKIFIKALKLHKAAILSRTKDFSGMIRDFIALMSEQQPKPELVAKGNDLWEALYFIFGAISSTFASFSTCFRYKKKLSTIFIDEAGQATLSSAIGTLASSKHAVVIGDPMQLEPVVTLPSEINDFLLRKCNANREFNLALSSVQIRADRVEPNGTFIAQMGKKSWIGSPLLKHKRCDENIFKISNEIAYDNLISWDKEQNEARLTNYWIDVPSFGSYNLGNIQGNAILDEMRALNSFLAFYQRRGGGKINDISVITPFVDVVNMGKNMKIALRPYTIHTMQGRESKIVILVLGGTSLGARSWASKKPNLLNVALTRARENFFVIGDFKAWSSLPYFRVLANNIAKIDAKNIEDIF